jgi:hypothetical protein
LIPLLPALALLPLLGGCSTSGDGYGSVAVVGSDDYIYYPGYEVYYSNTYHHYIYRDGSRWVTRATPPRIWVRGAPFVHMDFHDTPERHHADVIRTYPRTWKPAPHKPQSRPAQKAPPRSDGRQGNNDHRDHDGGRN